VPWPKADLATSVTRIPDVDARAFALWLSAAVAASMEDVAYSRSESLYSRIILLRNKLRTQKTAQIRAD
jgi:hypothetical protein